MMTRCRRCDKFNPPYFVAFLTRFLRRRPMTNQEIIQDLANRINAALFKLQEGDALQPQPTPEDFSNLNTAVVSMETYAANKYPAA